MTNQLKQLSEAATQGDWTVNPRATFSVEAPERRGICSTGGYSDNRRDGEELFAENVANAAFIAALVRAYRAGELIPAEEARAREAVAYEVAATEVGRYAGHYKQGSDGRNTFVIFADLMRAKSPDHTTTALEQIRQQVVRETVEAVRRKLTKISGSKTEIDLHFDHNEDVADCCDAILATLSEPKDTPVAQGDSDE